MATYLAFAAQAAEALQSLLETTRVSVQPSVTFVSCGVGVHEHFLPSASLERHLKKCHGEGRTRPIHNATFYYGKAEKGLTTSGGELGEEDIEGESSGELRSLLEAADSESMDGEGVIAAIERTATSAGEFYQHVQSWKRIPRAFASMKEKERELVAPSTLRRWMSAELSRRSNDEPVDEELVDYVAGLLDHPDFCQPDLLVLELREFLSGVSGFVLGLWKFLIVEIGLCSVFKTERGADMMAEVYSRKNLRTATPVSMVDTSQPQQSDADIAARGYKRRRASYRGKVGTKTGPEAFRELIQKHMIGLSVELDRELVHGGGFEEEHAKGNISSKTQEPLPEPLDWRKYTDALEVRNRHRPGRQDRPSRSRSNSRRQPPLRGRTPSLSNQRENGSSPGRMERRSSSRHRRRSRSRSRSSRRYHDSRRCSSHRRCERSASPGRDRYGSRRDRHREDDRR